MDFYSMTDKRIADELGGRFKSLRLRKNLTQQQLADASALSLNAIKALESGKGKISTIVAVLRELGALDELNSFIAEPGVSPLQLVKLQGKQRQRASHRRGKPRAEEDAEW